MAILTPLPPDPRSKHIHRPESRPGRRQQQHRQNNARWTGLEPRDYIINLVNNVLTDPQSNIIVHTRNSGSPTPLRRVWSPINKTIVQSRRRQVSWSITGLSNAVHWVALCCQHAPRYRQALYELSIPWSHETFPLLPEFPRSFPSLSPSNNLTVILVRVSPVFRLLKLTQALTA